MQFWYLYHPALINSLEERKNGVETLTHQKWSGSEIVDKMGDIVSGGLSSTGIMSAGVTETQFGGKHWGPWESVSST